MGWWFWLQTQSKLNELCYSVMGKMRRDTFFNSNPPSGGLKWDGEGREEDMGAGKQQYNFNLISSPMPPKY